MNPRTLALLSACFYATSAMGAKPFFEGVKGARDYLIKAGEMSGFGPVVRTQIVNADDTLHCSATKIQTSIDGDVYLTAAQCLSEKPSEISIDGKIATAYFLHPLYEVAPQYGIAAFLIPNPHKEKSGGVVFGVEDLGTLSKTKDTGDIFYHVGYGEWPDGSAPKQAFRVFPIFNDYMAESIYPIEETDIFGETMGHCTPGDLGGPLLRKNIQQPWVLMGVSVYAHKDVNCKWSIGIQGFDQLINGAFQNMLLPSDQLLDLTPAAKTLYPQVFQEEWQMAVDRLKDLPITQQYVGHSLRVKRPKQAGKHFLNAAREDDRNAQFSLGVMFNKGEAGVQDDELARYRYEQAAQQGHSTAQNHFGVMLEKGEGGVQDSVQARHWFEEAAKQGDGTAKFNLGIMFEDGKGGVQDSVQARYWFEGAAKQGKAPAQFYFGEMLLHGRGGVEDQERARYWLEESAKQDYFPAQFLFATTLVSGQGGAKDLEKARYWFEQAAKQGCAPAQYYFGYMLYMGEGGVKNIELAYDWFTKAANQGEYMAQFYLGVMLYMGEGGAKDLEGARDLFTQAAEKGYAAAQLNLGFMLYMGEGGTKDLEGARNWFEKAVKQAEVKAQNYLVMTHLAIALERAEGDVPGYKKAYYWLKKEVNGWYEQVKELLKTFFEPADEL